MNRLAIITTHPIQYNAPLFKLLAKDKQVQLKVFYTWGEAVLKNKFDPGFGKEIEWDIPLLDGYEYCFVKNISADPGAHTYKGIINPTLIEEVEKWKPGMILLYGWSYQSHLQAMRFFHKKVPVIFRGDSTLLDEKSFIKRTIRKVFLKWVYHYVDFALYVGSNNKKYFLEYGLKEKQLFFAPHAIDNNRFAEPDDIYCRDAVTWKNELGIGANDFVILFAGKLEPKKDPFFLLQLAKAISDEHTHFIFVGNGILETELKSQAGQDKRIHFIGFQNQNRMPVVYRLADVFVLPSKGPNETWGLSINEAMASNRPVMASSKAGGAADLIIDNKNGIIFEPGQIEPCIQFIQKLKDKNSFAAEAASSSKKIISGYTFEHVKSAMVHLLQQVSKN